ncbi:HNH endonuclease [Nocardia asteroides]|uniref:HNH endonuclease n=1 Tax=Nocardia asteroides TaxID=1824 RepID=UPI001E3F6A15|nr:HNH endonuclease [Nocardia asteroides]UGT63949.1 HNH endonuclease [Nocardia asteroides]
MGLSFRCYFDFVATWPEADRLALSAALAARSVPSTRPNALVGTPCFEWTGSRDDSGYGVILVRGERFRAHRMALVVAGVRDNPELVTHHHCRNRACVRQDHLELVTNRLNVLLGTGPSAVNADKLECNRGHLFGGTNLYRHPAGFRRCRACHRFHARRYRALAAAGAA